METKHKIIILTLIIAAVIIIFLPIKVPYKISSVAKLMPAHQWLLSRGPDGDILTTTIDNLSGINNSYQLTSFERGESMILDINQDLRNGQQVNKGDTLGTIYSSSQQENLIELNGELQVLTATLKASTSGVKRTEIKESRERLEMARSEYMKQQKIVERLNKLLKKELIAEEDFQTASDELSVLEKAVNVREAELGSSLSGDKDEQINLLMKQINAVENKISFLENEIDSQSSIITPFGGRMERSFSKDTILVLSNYEMGVALVPVSIDEADYLNEGDEVKFVFTNSEDALSGIVQTKQSVMQMIGGKQCILVLATVHNISKGFISGMITKSEINCGSIPLITYLERNIYN